MVQFKYTLDKSSKKFSCPNCGKRSFVRFVDNETGNYLTENYGRCDRETECKYYAQPTNEKKHFSTFKIPEVVPTSYIDNMLIDKTELDYNQNNFVKFLFNYFDVKQVGKVLEAYHIGTSKHWEGATIFWQIDDKEQMHAGKIMLYDKVTGKRIKEPYNHINWIHKAIKEPDFNLCQCLFGLHQTSEDYQKTIAIVESEKTAIVMSIFIPNFI